MTRIADITFKSAIRAPQPKHLRHNFDMRTSMRAEERPGYSLILELDIDLQLVHIIAHDERWRGETPRTAVPLTNVVQFDLMPETPAQPVAATAVAATVTQLEPVKTAHRK